MPCFTLKWGRKTSDDCSSDASTLPSPTMTGDAMFNYFANEFGFSRSQVRFFKFVSLPCSSFFISFYSFVSFNSCLVYLSVKLQKIHFNRLLP